jgi:hypothetical protein
MTIVANSGPAIQFGITTTSTGAVQQYNEDRGPSLQDLGSGMMDPRPFYNYKPGAWVTGTSTVGFSQYQTMGMLNNVASIDYIPAATSSNGIVASAQAVAGTNLTITATGAGVISTTITAPETGQAVSVFALDSTAAYVQFGQSGQVAMWNPAAGTGRCISIVLSSNLDAGSYFVAGRDMYGFKMTEQIATNSSNTITGKKAFKYISAISPSSTVTSTGVIVGYTDIYGFPAAVNYVGQNAFISLSSNAFTYNTASVILSSGTVTLASTAATQTSTTPDVRGTFTSSLASNGAIRLQITQNFTPAILAGISPATSSAIFGAPQFSSV